MTLHEAVGPEEQGLPDWSPQNEPTNIDPGAIDPDAVPLGVAAGEAGIPGGATNPLLDFPEGVPSARQVEDDTEGPLGDVLESLVSPHGALNEDPNYGESPAGMRPVDPLNPDDIGDPSGGGWRSAEGIANNELRGDGLASGSLIGAELREQDIERREREVRKYGADSAYEAPGDSPFVTTSSTAPPGYGALAYAAPGYGGGPYDARQYDAPGFAPGMVAGQYDARQYDAVAGYPGDAGPYDEPGEFETAPGPVGLGHIGIPNRLPGASPFRSIAPPVRDFGPPPAGYVVAVPYAPVHYVPPQGDGGGLGDFGDPGDDHTAEVRAEDPRVEDAEIAAADREISQANAELTAAQRSGAYALGAGAFTPHPSEDDLARDAELDAEIADAELPDEQQANPPFEIQREPLENLETRNSTALPALIGVAIAGIAAALLMASRGIGNPAEHGVPPEPTDTVATETVPAETIHPDVTLHETIIIDETS